MLRYEMLNDEPRLVQRLSRPTVYLDQCVWVDVGKDQELREQVVAALTTGGATLMLSAVSLLELAKVRDAAQLDNLALTIDALDVGFLECDPQAVVSREESHCARDGTDSPACDLDLLRFLEKHAKSLSPLRPAEMLLQLVNEAELSYLHALGGRLHQTLTPQVLRARANEEAYARARAQWKACATVTAQGPCTKALWEAVIAFAIVQRDMVLDAREWLDIVHAIISVAYCDVVVLDKRWADFVRQTGLGAGHIARVFARAKLSDALISISSWADGSREG